MLLNFNIQYTTVPGENVVIKFLEKEKNINTEISFYFKYDMHWALNLYTDEFNLGKNY